jgi:Protein of unknown function (DUF1488)
MNELNIEFTADEWYDHHRRKIVWFSAIVDDPLPAFRSHRARIHDAATRLLTERRFEDDGTVIIRSADLEQ